MTCLNLVIISEKTWTVNASVRAVDEEEVAEEIITTPNGGTQTPIATAPAVLAVLFFVYDAL